MGFQVQVIVMLVLSGRSQIKISTSLALKLQGLINECYFLCGIWLTSYFYFAELQTLQVEVIVGYRYYEFVVR